MKKILAPAILISTLTGCATIFEGGSQPVTFRTTPDAATISITNRAGEKIHSSATPVTVTLKRGAGYFKSEVYTVKITKEGYADKEITVTGTVNGWYVANILAGGLIGMLVVDPITGAMYNLAPESVNATLEQLDKKVSEIDGGFTIVLAENLPAEAWKHARLIEQKP